MSRRQWCISVLIMLGAGLLHGHALHAHEARPLHIRIEALTADAYLVTLKAPESITPDNLPEVRWPVTCASRTGTGITTATQRYWLRCPAGLGGEEIRIRYPLFNPSITTLITYSNPEHIDQQAILQPGEAAWRVPVTPGGQGLALNYLRLGMMHILTGVDHLLFITALMLIAGTGRRIVLAVTGFTLAHSLTLSLAALEMIEVPIPPTEVAIALSIAFLARELVSSDGASLTRRQPLLVAVVFGLLHGLGFAAALSEAGLPQHDVLLALLSFNLGVEAGQILFIVTVLLALRLASRVAGKYWLRLPAYLATATFVLGYGIGVTAAFWCVQRIMFW